MYRWNKKNIDNLLKYMCDIDCESDDYYNTLYNLIAIKKGYTSDTINDNLSYENKEYETLKKQDPLLRPITNKYYNEYGQTDLNFKEYKNIYSKKKDILLFTRDNIKNINPKWAKTLEPFIFNNDYIDYRKINENYICYLKYLGKFYISLSKENNITDFIYPTHEFLHIYSTILNNNSFYNIEYEFLSILGELITTYEMRKKTLFTNETIKYDINSFISTINYIKTIILKKQTIFDNIDSDKKIKYLIDFYKQTKRNVLKMYSTSLEYNYSTVISYYLALELFNIYIKDKEKCINICENIITSNDPLIEKLNKNNINLLENDDNYIKQLKKNIL